MQKLQTTDVGGASRGGRMMLRKPTAHIEAEIASHGLKRTLGPINLTMLGVGSTIGAGIYVMTGSAAANYAGPAVLISFLIAGLACVFTALSYGELASVMPVSGSAYTYAYAAVGEVFAWTTGWLLLLEYGISTAAVAAGFSGYATSLLHDFGLDVPPWLHTPLLLTSHDGPLTTLVIGGGLDLVAAFASLLVTAILVIGVTESATVNTVIVFIKVSVLVIFVALGISAVHPSNWVPFIPPSQGGFRFGIPGVFRAASVIFFAYVGFEAVSCAAAEARNPRRDVPIGILTSLAICTVTYLCVAAVLTGIVPYRQLGVADPLAIAVDAMHEPWLALLIKVGAVTGLCSVMLVLLYGQSRIFYTMSRDGLLPRAFHTLHPRFRTPWIGTIIVGVASATAAATLPIDIISDLVSLGTTVAFGIVSFTVIWQRNARPDLVPPFRVPLGALRIRGVWIGIVPSLGILFCVVMAAPLLIDLVTELFTGNPVPALLLFGYAALGAICYLCYGMRHSTLGRELRPGR
ncbi:amino acid permease [Lichenicoccus sp.]|uniref:amino acid permease n=1 Tax=Lichenicoccus sp. TaxID=2781899 RepID=UPI003D0F76F8